MKVLLIDNSDLFTSSLIHEFEKRDCEVAVLKNNADLKSVDSALKKSKISLIVISPGPGNVENSGNSVNIVRTYAGKMPIFGVGLGQQCIITAFEGAVSKSAVSHGKIGKITHDSKTIFRKVANPFSAGIYSSMFASDVPYSLEVSARDEYDHVMGVRHKEYFVEGVQFHPDSLLTVYGSMILDNLLDEVRRR